MNCLPNQITEQASGRSQVVVSLIASESAFPSSNPENPVISELELEAEMNRRAGMITDVLARIMEEPAACRHWGLNE
jgi:hypothetical protein